MGKGGVVINIVLTGRLTDRVIRSGLQLYYICKIKCSICTYQWLGPGQLVLDGYNTQVGFVLGVQRMAQWLPVGNPCLSIQAITFEKIEYPSCDVPQEK